jgi:cytochrome c peroxidase
MQPSKSIFYLKTIGILFFILTITSCVKEKGCTDPLANNFNSRATIEDGSCMYNFIYNPTPYELAIPPLFKHYILPPYISSKNPLTKEGVELGRRLFHDTLLDGYSGATRTNRFSCATCHKIDYAFGGNNDSVAPLINMAWNNTFKWNGKIHGTIEDLMVFEVEHQLQTNLNMINSHPTYPDLFLKAFNVTYISYEEIEYALSQYFRTFISGNSRFDRYLMGQQALTLSELNGFNIYMSENKGDCFHCHGSPQNPLWTDNSLHNTGLDASPDLGLAGITGNPNDIGKFKTPTLRNLAFTAPYMHDDRFATLEEVINHYSEGLVYSPTIDPLMKSIAQGGVQLTPQDKIDLKAFLLSLTDSSFVNNPLLHSPF